VTGQPYTCPSDLLQALFRFLSGFTKANPNRIPGLFGASCVGAGVG